LGENVRAIYPDEDLGGVYPYPAIRGEIRINGAVHRFSGIRDAEAAGVGGISRSCRLVKEDDNRRKHFSWARAAGVLGLLIGRSVQPRAKAADRIAFSARSRTPIGALGIGQQQLVE